MIDRTWHKTACNLCYVNCGIEVAVDGEGQAARITKIRGDADNPKSAGYLCNKAQGIVSYVHHRDRLTTPLKRRADGTFEAISWESAISEIAARLRQVTSHAGGASLALYGGGGQGNHAGGAYATALMRGLGSRHVFNALAQEKTGDFWVNGHLFGAQTCHTAEDIEHCDLLLVIGANPWLAHGFANARHHLNTIRKDHARKLIVIDPRRTETAEHADLHLAVRPGTDAFLLGAILATLLRRNAFDREFIAAHTTGFETVEATLRALPIAEYAAAADVSLDLIERTVDMIQAARGMVVRVELGIQQGLNSTLISYLEKLLFLLTGHFGRPGTNTLHGWLQPLWGNGRGQRYAPLNLEIIAGLLPPNSLADAIENDHPERLRALWVDSRNPANTVADTARVQTALQALELLVVVDVAFTETAALAHYVLPASSQYEKGEYTLFNFEYPVNYFHVRRPILAPLGGTLPEPEIYTRLARALDLLPPVVDLESLTVAARGEPAQFARTFEEYMAAHPSRAAVAPLILYNTLGATLPVGTATAAPLWLSAQRLARTRPGAVRAVLSVSAAASAIELGAQLFMHIIESPSGTAFSIDDDVWDLIETTDRRVRLAIPQLLDALATLDPANAIADPEFPFVLSAGQRRAQNANQIFRDPAFRRSDPDGALFIHPDDLATLNVVEHGWMSVTSRRGRLVVRATIDPGLRRGYVVLPHGYGQAYPSADGERLVCGPRINLLTDSRFRDPIAGTPYHKNIPVRLVAATASEAAAAEANSARIFAKAEPALAVS